MNDLLTQYLEISVLRESGEGGDQKEEGGAVKGKVSYSVSGDLQIT